MVDHGTSGAKAKTTTRSRPAASATVTGGIAGAPVARNINHPAAAVPAVGGTAVGGDGGDDGVVISRHVDALLLWRDPKQSGIVFGVGALILILMWWRDWHLVSLVLYATSATCVLCLAFFSFLRARGSPPEYTPAWWPLNAVKLRRDRAHFLMDRCFDAASGLLDATRAVAEVHSPYKTGMTVVYTAVAAWLASWATLYTWVALFWFGAFLGPAGYLKNKAAIDGLIARAYLKLHELVGKIPAGGASGKLSSTSTTATTKAGKEAPAASSQPSPVPLAPSAPPASDDEAVVSDAVKKTQ